VGGVTTAVRCNTIVVAATRTGFSPTPLRFLVVSLHSSALLAVLLMAFSANSSLKLADVSVSTIKDKNSEL
jgi:hypothetical protein